MNRVLGIKATGVALCLALGACFGGPVGPSSSESSPRVPRNEPTTGQVPEALRNKEVAFVGGSESGRADHIYVARADGSQLRRLSDGSGCKQDPEWSPDGSMIAYRYLPSCDYQTGVSRIAVIDTTGGRPKDLTAVSGLPGLSPTWSPDGRKLAFAGGPNEQHIGIFVMNADGTDARRLTTGAREAQYPAWSPDGKSIAFVLVSGRGFDIYVINADGTGLRRLTTQHGYNEAPMWSPDSTRLAYVREGERAQMFVMDADGSKRRELRSVAAHDAGFPASWAPGDWIVLSCRLPDSPKIGICAVRPDGTGFSYLLDNRTANFPAWKP